VGKVQPAGVGKAPVDRSQQQSGLGETTTERRRGGRRAERELGPDGGVEQATMERQQRHEGVGQAVAAAEAERIAAAATMLQSSGLGCGRRVAGRRERIASSIRRRSVTVNDVRDALA